MKDKISAIAEDLNGVAVSALNDTIEAIKEEPKIADFRFKLKNRWIDGSLNRSEIKEFYGACKWDDQRKVPFVYENDEAPALLGQDTAPNPVEYLLHALAGCMTTTMVYHAAAKGIKIDEIESEFEGELDLHGFLKLDSSVRNGFKVIHARFKVKSSASAEQLKELATQSPVYDMIANPVPVALTVEIK